MFNINPFRKHGITVDAVEDVLDEKKKLDPVDKDELKGTHDDRKDGDIDNDGDEDNSDKFLHKKRKAISKSMNAKKEDSRDEEEKEMDPEEMKAKLKKKTANAKNGETAVMNPKMDNSKGKGSEMEQKEETFRDKLIAVLEGDRAKHYKGAAEAETMDDKYKGDGAKKMKKDHEGETIDIEKQSHDDASKAGRVTKASPKRKGDAVIGDKAMPKVSKEETMHDPKIIGNITNAYKSMSEKAEVSNEDLQTEIDKDIFEEAELEAIEELVTMFVEADEKNLQELSPELLKRYRQKAFKYYDRHNKYSRSHSKKQKTLDTLAKRHKGLGSAINRGVARGTHYAQGPSTRKDQVKRSTMTGKLPHQLPKAYMSKKSADPDVRSRAESVEENKVNELSVKTLDRYAKLAKTDVKRRKAKRDIDWHHVTPDRRHHFDSETPKERQRKANRSLAKAKSAYKKSGPDRDNDWNKSGPNIKKRGIGTHYDL